MIARIIVICCTLLIAGCSANSSKDGIDAKLPAKIDDRYLEKLTYLPSPTRPVNVAVYSFTDLTGQRRASEVYADLSHAVSQGGNDILIGMLINTGQGKLFNVAERDELKAVVQEQQLRAATRRGNNSKALISADYILTGGIIGYDTNYLTGGAGARYLGIGGNVKYRSDLITVALRLVDVKSGRVLIAEEAYDTVVSYGAAGGATRYFSGRLFEADAGFTSNEVITLSTRRAIAKALLAMIEEAVEDRVWRMGADQAHDILTYLNDEEPGPVLVKE